MIFSGKFQVSEDTMIQLISVVQRHKCQESPRVFLPTALVPVSKQVIYKQFTPDNINLMYASRSLYDVLKRGKV